MEKVQNEPLNLCSMLTEDEAARFANLLTRIATQSDREAFAELFAYYAPRLKGFLLRLGVGSARAEEIVQDVMVVVWRTADQFDEQRGSVSAWIFRIARNRRADACSSADSDLDPDGPAVLPTAWARSREPEDIRAVERSARTALIDLPVEQLVLLRLAFYEGRTQREIAIQRALPLSAVKATIRTALASLRAGISGASCAHRTNGRSQR